MGTWTVLLAGVNGAGRLVTSCRYLGLAADILIAAEDLYGTSSALSRPRPASSA
jgi:hypothetical protein